MTELILTQYSGKIIGPIAKLLGYCMNGIYLFLSNCFGIENIGLTIIILTFIFYLFMLPLTFKQQKFAKLNQAMSPEIAAIQKKYKGKTDQASVMKQNEEMQQVYEKYGVSPMGTCLPLLIQMPIMLALYQVIYNVPAYVGSVKNVFTDLVNSIMATDGYSKIMEGIATANKVVVRNPQYGVKGASQEEIANSLIDVLYKLPTSGWESLKESFSGLSDLIGNTQHTLEHLNNFLTLNIGNSPWSIITSAFHDKQFLLLFIALMIPVVSYLTQMLNLKLTPQASNSSDNGSAQAEAMQRQMKTMNNIMPLFSFVFCFTVPVGLGIYWIAGSVCRTLQQLLINHHIQNMDLDTIIAKNQKKMEKKKEKMGLAQNQISNNAKIKTKNLQVVSEKEREEKLLEADEKKRFATSGSLASKANMVRDFNEKNNK